MPNIGMLYVIKLIAQKKRCASGEKLFFVKSKFTITIMPKHITITNTK